ncbi:hypothetical protein Slin15195_G094100 [Septoria linicola]|uniref:Uncharacterized protein n=1 Tax=Septoria linicola TaxID=215465 RepID=A0A9Q9B2K7_9PEZI|nr:hypothetical protein Slin15195_G094100 [Septoria linicola]
MPALLQELLTFVGRRVLDEFETTINILEDALTGRSDARRSGRRLSLLLCLWPLVTGLSTKRKVARQSKLLIGVAATTFFISGLYMNEESVKLINYGLLGCEGMGWYGFLRILLPSLRKHVLRGRLVLARVRNDGQHAELDAEDTAELVGRASNNT